MAGYDFGVGLSVPTTSGANINSPFSVQGGGIGTTRPNTLALWLIVGVVALIGLWLFLGGKR